MIKILNIVNGDTSISIMKEAGIQGDFLPWKDFLHEGPVPKKATLEALSTIRSKFIASFTHTKLEFIEEDFKKRDNLLKNYQSYNKIVLWFEHDLYDQLQLLQILAWFSTQNIALKRLTLICNDKYLGESSVQQIKKLQLYETDVLEEHLEIAKEAWDAFCSENPKDLASLLTDSTEILPFLKGAVYRMLQEYPSTKYGLSRTEYQALQAIADGEKKRIDIFKKSQSVEGRKFMGETIFWEILEQFELFGVIKNDNKLLTITPLGQKILATEENWLNIKPIQRSIGGVTLTPENLWCWDMQEESIKQYHYSKSLKILVAVK